MISSTFILLVLLFHLIQPSSSFSLEHNANTNTNTNTNTNVNTQQIQNQRGSNRLFLDTAIESEWSALIPLGIFHGITTNPTLLENAGHDCTIQNIHSLATKALQYEHCHEFMCQSWGSTADEMYHNGMALSKINRSNIVIKVPITSMGTMAASKLIHNGVRVCLTACYASDQALIASAVGAEYIAPYLGRMEEQKKDGSGNGVDGVEECLRMQQIVQGMNSGRSDIGSGATTTATTTTRVLVASIRNVKSMTDLVARGGMDTFTFSPDIARKLFLEQLTIDAAADFEAAAQRCGAGGTYL